MIITRTPFRISFVGGGTDLRAFYSKEYGQVLSTTINKHIYVAVKRQTDIVDFKYRINWSKVEFKNKFDEIKNVDFIILCLPTPLTNNKTPDMSFITNTMKNISKHLKIGQAISLESTTYPGTCREVLVPYLKNFNIGKDFFLIYSPEREDPGNKKFSILKTPKVLGGYSSLCQKIGSLTYKLLKIKIVKVSSLEVAEFTKLLENIYRSVNIGMINEMKILCNKLVKKQYSGRHFTLIELRGKKQNNQMMIVAISNYKNEQWFFKLMGNKSAVLAEKNAFLNLLKQFKAVYP